MLVYLVFQLWFKRLANDTKYKRESRKNAVICLVWQQKKLKVSLHLLKSHDQNQTAY